jgi:hypothetical protein
MYVNVFQQHWLELVVLVVVQDLVYNFVVPIPVMLGQQFKVQCGQAAHHVQHPLHL